MARILEKLRNLFKPRKDVLERLALDHEEEFRRLFELCRPYTMTSPLRLYALYKAVHYIEDRQIPGDVVECGVWRGGSAMLCALVLSCRGQKERTIYLYDTFAGMPPPSPRDRRRSGKLAMEEWQKRQRGPYNEWCYAPLEEVQRNMATTSYPPDKLVYVKGKVEDSIPGTTPSQIALLRLDTDWYSSTYHELVHLYPLLTPGGVLIVDDYGFWQGSREAVDQYFKECRQPILLNRIDNSGVIGIKL